MVQRRLWRHTSECVEAWRDKDVAEATAKREAGKAAVESPTGQSHGITQSMTPTIHQNILTSNTAAAAEGYVPLPTLFANASSPTQVFHHDLVSVLQVENIVRSVARTEALEPTMFDAVYRLKVVLRVKRSADFRGQI